MSPRLKSNVAEFKPAVAALEPLGFRLVDLQGAVATFQRGEIRFNIVNDRGFWCLHGDDEELKCAPMRKTLTRATQDAVAWIKRKQANHE